MGVIWMKNVWNHKPISVSSLLVGLLPVAFILIIPNGEDRLEVLAFGAFIGIITLIQALRTRQKNVLILENKTLYKKNLLGKQKVYELVKYKEFVVEHYNKRNSVLIGYYLNENNQVKKDVILNNAYNASLDSIRKSIEKHLYRTEFADEEQDVFFYNQKKSFLKDDVNTLEQESYRKTVNVANIILAVCFTFIVALTFVFVNTVLEAILATMLMVYTVIMFRISKNIMMRSISIADKRKYNLYLYLPGLVMMIALAFMIFDN